MDSMPTIPVSDFVIAPLLSVSSLYCACASLTDVVSPAKTLENITSPSDVCDDSVIVKIPRCSTYVLGSLMLTASASIEGGPIAANL